MNKVKLSRFPELSMFNVSRVWNKVAYKLIDVGIGMIWDYTHHNQDLLKNPGDATSEYSRYIMSSIYYNVKQKEK